MSAAGYITREIRWFSLVKMERLEIWLGQIHNLAQSEKRTDNYLIQNDPGLGVKLREGKLEIKKRTGSPAKMKLSADMEGVCEDYIKWEMELRSKDNFSPDHWMEIGKERDLIYLGLENGILKILHPDERPDEGCQVEYTKLHIFSKEYYTFGLEWFGEDLLHIPESVFVESGVDTDLRHAVSMGYAEFILKFQNGMEIFGSK